LVLLESCGCCLRRHCEERSDEAIQLFVAAKEAGLLRFARNDGC
jgi:hypothetical protein